MNERGWSFCIVTAPNNEEILSRCIAQIEKEFDGINNFEVIVVGQGKKSEKSLVRYIDFNEEVFSINLSNLKRFIREKSLKRLFYRTGAICHKKNLAANNAKYDKLCLMHDYVGLEPGWREGYEKFGDSWEISVTKVYNANGDRHRDWMNWDYPGIGPGLMPYDSYSSYMYISGAYFCVKREFYLKNPLDEKLFWGEGEDVVWSKRVRVKTEFKMNQFSSVKYLKLKPLDDAPNVTSWIENSKKLNKIFYRKN